MKIVENLLGLSLRVGRRPHHQWWHCTDDGRLDHAAFAVARDIAHDLTATAGMADMDGFLQVEMRRQSRQIVGIMIHVVAVRDLGEAAMAATIMGQ